MAAYEGRDTRRSSMTTRENGPGRKAGKATVPETKTQKAKTKTKPRTPPDPLVASLLDPRVASLTDKLPATAFVHPEGHNRLQVEALARRILELAIAHAAGAASRPPLPAVNQRPNQLPVVATIPEQPVADDELVQQIDTLLHACMNPATPRYLAHMDTLPTTFSALGDFLASLVNNNMLCVEMSPVFSLLETTLFRRTSSWVASTSPPATASSPFPRPSILPVPRSAPRPQARQGSQDKRRGSHR